MENIFPAPDKVLDISGETCPMTFVRTRLTLDKLLPGQVLEILLQGEEPRQNVPRTVLDHGFTLLDQQDLPDGKTRLLIRKPASN